MDFPGGSDGKASVYNVRDLGSIPGLGRFPGEGNGNPLQYSCLENPMDGGAWCRLLSMESQRVGDDFTFTFIYIYIYTFECLVTQSCPTFYDPLDCSPPGFSVQGIFQQEYWNGLPFPTPGDLSDPGTEPTSPVSPALHSDSLPTDPSGKPHVCITVQFSRLALSNSLRPNGLQHARLPCPSPTPRVYSKLNLDRAISRVS